MILIRILIVFKQIPHQGALYRKGYHICETFQYTVQIEHSPYFLGPGRVLKTESFLEFQICFFLELSMIYPSSRDLA